MEGLRGVKSNAGWVRGGESRLEVWPRISSQRPAGTVTASRRGTQQRLRWGVS